MQHALNEEEEAALRSRFDSVCTVHKLYTVPLHLVQESRLDMIRLRSHADTDRFQSHDDVSVTPSLLSKTQHSCVTVRSTRRRRAVISESSSEDDTYRTMQNSDTVGQEHSLTTPCADEPAGLKCEPVLSTCTIELVPSAPKKMENCDGAVFQSLMGIGSIDHDSQQLDVPQVLVETTTLRCPLSSCRMRVTPQSCLSSQPLF